MPIIRFLLEIIPSPRRPTPIYIIGAATILHGSIIYPKGSFAVYGRTAPGTRITIPKVPTLKKNFSIRAIHQIWSIQHAILMPMASPPRPPNLKLTHLFALLPDFTPSTETWRGYSVNIGIFCYKTHISKHPYTHGLQLLIGEHPP